MNLFALLRDVFAITIKSNEGKIRLHALNGIGLTLIIESNAFKIKHRAYE